MMNDITRNFINEHLKDDINRLSLSKFPENIDKTFVIRQIQARQILKKKLPSWSENEELYFPKKLSLEQCSSETTARYKASLLKGKTLIDLTGGMGVDTSFLSDNFEKTYYVESQTELCELARHNFEVLGKKIDVVNANAEDFLAQCDAVDCIYLDPARRDEYGRKMVSLHDCSPDVAELQELMLEKAKTIMVKLSPMLDIDIIRKELSNISEIKIVAVKNECKELLVILDRESKSQRLTAVDLHEKWNIVFTEDEEDKTQVLFADEIGNYLYEPGVAVMKAGYFRLVSERYNVKKLHRNSHLYTSDELVPDFPGRIFEVVNVVPFDKKSKQNIWQLPTPSSQFPIPNSQFPIPNPQKSISRNTSIAVRNFPLSADELRKYLGLKDGNDFYIFGTTMKGEKKVLVMGVKVV